MRIRYVLPLLLLALTACGVKPDGSNGQHRDFSVPDVSYQQAYQRATDYFNQCVRGFVGLSPNVTTGNIYADEHRASMQTINGSGVIIARLTAVASGEGSKVDVVTIKRAPAWNVKDLDAIQHAVETGTITCK